MTDCFSTFCLKNRFSNYDGKYDISKRRFLKIILGSNWQTWSKVTAPKSCSLWIASSMFSFLGGSSNLFKTSWKNKQNKDYLLTCTCMFPIRFGVIYQGTRSLHQCPINKWWTLADIAWYKLLQKLWMVAEGAKPNPSVHCILSNVTSKSGFAAFHVNRIPWFFPPDGISKITGSLIYSCMKCLDRKPYYCLWGPMKFPDFPWFFSWLYPDFIANSLTSP